MDGKREYRIVINGIEESINAVDSLVKQLNTLEAKINSLQNKSVDISAGGGSKTSSSKSSLSEDEKLERQIEQIDAKRVAYSKDIYQNYLAAKDVLKETVADQKQLAAAERVQANTYSNTMEGMKQKLADLKSIHFTTDISTDEFKKQTKEINEITQALKKLEEEYGVFGRNVGNYKSAADGFSKYKIEVGGVVREFDTAKQAAKTLSNELLNLPKGAKGAEELRAALQQVKSEIQDIGKSSVAMDNLLDTMEGFVAIANVGQGIRGLFGVDDAEMQKSIKNLVALQNILKGIETINKQINTREGIGAWIAPFNSQIDKATAKTLVFNRALLGTGTAAKTASVAIKGFSKALKVALSAGVLIVIDLLIDGLMKLIDSFKKVDEATERTKEVQKDLAEAYGQAQGKLMQYKSKVDSFNGSKKQEKKLVEELNKEFGTTLGTYKSLSQWQDVLKKKGDAYIQTLVNQAKAQAALNEVTAAYMNLENVRQKAANGDYSHWYQTKQQDAEAAARAIEDANKRIIRAEENLKKTVTENEKFAKTNKMGDYAPQVTKNAKKTENALEKEQTTLNQLELRLMKDGLNKKLRQLDEEERQTINKLKENGRKSATAIQQVQRSYAQLRLKEINEYLSKLEESIKQSARNIAAVKFEINIKDIENQINELKNEFDEASMHKPIINTITANDEIRTIAKERNVTTEKMSYAEMYNYLFNKSEATGDADDFYIFLTRYIKDKNKELYQDISDYVVAIRDADEENRLVYMKGLENTMKKVEDIFEEEYKNELLIVRNYTSDINQTLEDSIKQRLKAQDVYNKEVIEKLVENINKQEALNVQMLNEQNAAATEAEEQRYQAVQKPLQEQNDALEEAIKKFKATNEKEKESLEQLKKDLKVIQDQMEQQRKQHYDKIVQINEDYTNKLKQNEINAAKERNSIQEQYFNNQISNLRDAQSKINEILNKQPKTNALGIVNLGATKKQYNELLNATRTTVSAITAEKLKLEALWKKGLITPEAKNAITQQLNDLEAEIRQLLQTVMNESNQVIPQFVQSCQVYLNGVMDAFQTIMNAVWDAQDTAFDKEQEQLDKANDAIEKALDKQQEIVEQHKDAMNDAEEELKTARGARRQHLIDQINAEIAAQRAAAKEEQKLQRKKEANEKKQEELDKKRKKAEYERQILQAIVNGAMSVTYAAMNTWPIPAVPLMALAAAATATQVAIMKANKPYAKGGLLEGASHKEGGIPVGNTGIEVEGKEYIIRKESTTPNVELLDYINSKKRRMSLDDFIDFYTSGKLKSNIKSISPSSKYAEGGQLTLDTSNVNINDRLLDAFESYSRRPMYVSVVDIQNKMDDVNTVKALAGIR
jgi:hypothetical protein